MSAEGRFEVDGGYTEGYIEVYIEGYIEGYSEGYSVRLGVFFRFFGNPYFNAFEASQK